MISECPETGIGLGVPRPRIRLEREASGVRLLGSRDEELTPLMEAYASGAAARFRDAGVSGIVLKSRSPSCGTGDVKLHVKGTVVSENGTGIFAGGLAGALPDIPRICETDLDDPARRDHWLTRVFASAELRALGSGQLTIAALQGFHARWKMVLMAHAEETARELGHRLAGASGAPAAFSAYRTGFLAGLAEPAAVGTHHNVLLHLAGHLKKQLGAAARIRLNREITAFLAREVPLAMPVRSLARGAAEFAVDSLADQAYLAERPAALGYRERIYGEG